MFISSVNKSTRLENIRPAACSTDSYYPSSYQQKLSACSIQISIFLPIQCGCKIQMQFGEFKVCLPYFLPPQ